MPRPGARVTLVNSGLVVLPAERVRVTSLLAADFSCVLRGASHGEKGSRQ